MVTSIASHRVFISSSSKLCGIFYYSVGLEYFLVDHNARKAKVESFWPATERFIRHVLMPLETLYGLSSESINVFYDLVGPLTAFNRSGRIFVNVRYYCAWHDEVRSQAA